MTDLAVRRPARRSGRAAPLVAALLALGVVVVAMAVVAAKSGFGWDVARDPLAATAAALDGRTRVAVYGDSLVTQAEPYLRTALTLHGRADVRIKAFPGTAICDWLPDLRRSAHHLHPHAVILEFSGDSFTPCMRDARTHAPLGGSALVARYQADAGRAMAALGDRVAVYWVAAPPPRDEATTALAEQIRAVYQALPGRYPNARYVDAGAAVEADGRYAATLPCLPEDHCPPGVTSVVVRSPDGAHFCPLEVPGNGACPVWSSGAFRFARAMAAPVVRDQRL